MKIYVDSTDLAKFQNGSDPDLCDGVNTIPGGVLTQLKYV
jgi:hypothetical protein